MYRQRSASIDRNLLVALFRMVPPEYLLRHILAVKGLADELPQRRWVDTPQATDLLNLYQRELQPEKSLVELNYPLTDALSKDRLLIEKNSFHYSCTCERISFLHWPFYIARSYLEQHNYGYWASIAHALRWRQLTLQIPQDILICALHARKKTEFSNHDHAMPQLDWPVHLPIYHSILWAQLMEKAKANKLTDNHMHYIAGPDTVYPAWISIMNRPTHREGDLRQAGLLNKNLQGSVIYTPGHELLDWGSRLALAAVIRLALFKIAQSSNDISHEAHQANDPTRELITTLKQNLKKVYTYIKNENEIGINQILQEIDVEVATMRYTQPTLMYRPDSAKRVLDYACISKLYSKYVQETPGEEWLHLGERYIWTMMFKAFYENEPWFQEVEDVFTLYLQLFTQFRAELIQSNHAVGFENFYDYQDRKEALLDSDPILQSVRKGLWLKSRLSGKHKQILPLSHQNIKIGPGSKGTDFAMNVIERDLHQADLVGIDSNIEAELELKKLTKKSKNKHPYKRYFKRIGIGIHFIKTADDFNKLLVSPSTIIERDLVIDLIKRQNHYYGESIRHEALRNQVRSKALEIKQFLTYGSNETVKLLRGIDAASNELFARIEVFAQAMRFLRGQRPARQMFGERIPQIKINSHAGEEIVDIIDGLRYIDECIRFQELKSGDTIGHALALATDPHVFYKKKGYRTDITAQNYIDNIAWALSASHRMGISIQPRLAEHLQAEFYRVFTSVYQRQQNENITPEIYYLAWKLRGDNPRLYKSDMTIGIESGAYNKSKFTPRIDSLLPDDWHYYDCAKIGEEDGNIREIEAVFKLVQAYHYDFEVRKRGLEMHHLKIERDLLTLISDLQAGMSRKVSNMGLFVETLPSVNLAISPIERYDEHPILRFSPIPGDKTQQPIYWQHTSVNTDNPGVCNLSIENEYMLLYCALQKRVDSEGERIHSDADLQAWISSLIDHSHQQIIRIEP